MNTQAEANTQGKNDQGTIHPLSEAELNRLAKESEDNAFNIDRNNTKKPAITEKQS